MSVLPVLGYKPITSYFSRADRKRKETSQIVNEPKRLRVSLPAKRHIDEKVLDSDEEIHNESLLLTPLTRLPRRKQGVALPTPPTTIPPSRKASRIPRTTSGPPILEVVDLTIPSKVTATRPLARDATIRDNDSDSNVTSHIHIEEALGHLVFPINPRPAELHKAASREDYVARKSRLDNNLIVESSQSQYLYIESPRKQKEQRMRSLLSTAELIPSSQSEEEELKDPSDVTAGSPSLFVPNRGYPSVPLRTASDELFPIPIQDSILQDIFPDEQVGSGPLCVTSAPITTLHQPIVEEELTPNMTANCGFPHLTTQESSLSQGSYGPDSYSSLPVAVWEFKEMFGTDDESYPADFPESLRL